VKIPLPRSLHMRIMLAIAILQFLVVGMFSVYMMAQLVGNEVANRQALGYKAIAMISPAVERMLMDRDRQGLEPYLRRLAAEGSITGVVLKDARGEVLFSESKPAVTVHPVAAALKASALGTKIYSELRHGGEFLGVITLDLSNALLNENVEALLHNVLYLFLILLGVDLLASELLIKYFVSPLGPLTVMAMDVSQGNWDTTIQPSERASEEVRNLTNAFVESANIMRKQIKELEQTRGQLADNENRLRNLVNNMQEVLLEVDKYGRVQFLNPVWEYLTGYSPEASINRPFSDFLMQPQQQAHFTSDMLERISLYDLQLEIRAQSGESVWMQMNTTLQYNEAGEFTGIISTLVDVSENLRLQELQREHEQDLYKLTITDPLTGVYNRRHFDELLSNLLQINLNKGRQVGLIIIDIDGFKFINDTYGHPVGDEVLKAVAKTLTTGGIQQGGAVARLAGDEFAVIVQNVNDEQADKVARTIHRALGSVVIKLAVGQLQIQTSMGVAVAPGHGREPQDLMRAADVALYHAKKSGRNRVDTLSADVGEAIMDIFSQGFELRNALSAGMIAPFIQPIIELRTGEVFAYEVLTRLRRGDDYVVADEFIPIAEDLGLIREMDLFIIKLALATVPRNVHLFLNISLSSFYTPEFNQELRALLLSPDAQSRAVTIEFTERQTTDISESFIRYFDELRAAGCRIALDDFGVGYSTYDYLRQLKPDFVKIDGSFVQHILSSPQDAKIVQQITELSRISAAHSIAEHVEDEPTFRMLQSLGVKYGQGYYFGRPKPIVDYFSGTEAATG
jgi:diguanylate cyclase (GGDEF)-like protein/PAS domain S-box-containing protein